jgi:post-segregation antitoxin (ccd killing protein)
MAPTDRHDKNSRPTFRRGLEAERTPSETPAQWLAENRKAIEHYNERIAAMGVFGEEYRRF